MFAIKCFCRPAFAIAHGAADEVSPCVAFLAPHRDDAWSSVWFLWLAPAQQQSRAGKPLRLKRGSLAAGSQVDPEPLIAYFLRAGGQRLLSEADCWWLGSLL
jgi:hypothetical protein